MKPDNATILPLDLDEVARRLVTSIATAAGPAGISYSELIRRTGWMSAGFRDRVIGQLLDGGTVARTRGTAGSILTISKGA